MKNIKNKISNGVKRIGIECHNLEGARFGVGQTLIQLLEEISAMPALAGKFEFYLYFKKEIPQDEILNSSIFHKKILRLPLVPPSFTLLYHLLIPVQYFRDSLDGFFFPGYMLPPLFLGKSAVLLTNDVPYEIHHGKLPFHYKLAYCIFSWWAAWRANVIITISETAKKEIAKYYKISPEKIEVVPWGLNKDLAAFQADSADIAEVKKKYSIQSDFIFSWGQAFPRRHVREAILAFAKIAKDLPNLQYFIASADKYNPPILEELAKKINSELGWEAIVYRSYVEKQEDLFALIKAARLAVYISSSEAMGLPPIEALSLKTPSVVADNALTREIFGDNAFFIQNPDNTGEIAKKLKEGISDEDQRSQIIKNSAIITNKFQWSENLNSLLKIFEKIF